MMEPLDRIPESIFRLSPFVVITLLLLMLVFPLYFMATTAFKIEREIYSELTWLPRHPTLDNFQAVSSVFASRSICRNTLIVAPSRRVSWSSSP